MRGAKFLSFPESNHLLDRTKIPIKCIVFDTSPSGPSCANKLVFFAFVVVSAPFSKDLPAQGIKREFVERGNMPKVFLGLPLGDAKMVCLSIEFSRFT